MQRGHNRHFPLDQKPLTIVEVEIPDSPALRLFQFTTDDRKATVAVERSLLPALNAAVVQPLNFALMPNP
jgi:hypothetical protein